MVADLHLDRLGAIRRVLPDVVDAAVAAHGLLGHRDHVRHGVDRDCRGRGHARLEAAVGVLAVEFDDGRVDLLVVAHPAARGVGDRSDADDASRQHLVRERLDADEGSLTDRDLVDLGFLHLDDAAHLRVVGQHDDLLALAHADAFAHGLAAAAVAVDARVDHQAGCRCVDDGVVDLLVEVDQPFGGDVELLLLGIHVERRLLALGVVAGFDALHLELCVLEVLGSFDALDGQVVVDQLVEAVPGEGHLGDLALVGEFVTFELVARDELLAGEAAAVGQPVPLDAEVGHGQADLVRLIQDAIGHVTHVALQRVAGAGHLQQLERLVDEVGVVARIDRGDLNDSRRALLLQRGVYRSRGHRLLVDQLTQPLEHVAVGAVVVLVADCSEQLLELHLGDAQLRGGGVELGRQLLLEDLCGGARLLPGIARLLDGDLLVGLLLDDFADVEFEQLLSDLDVGALRDQIEDRRLAFDLRAHAGLAYGLQFAGLLDGDRQILAGHLVEVRIARDRRGVLAACGERGGHCQ